MTEAMTRQQVREVDRFAIEQLQLPGIVLMENAGRGACEVMRRRGGLGRVLIACGKGNNAGDGYVIARHALLEGAEVRLLTAWTETLSGDAGVNQRVWLAMGQAEQPWSAAAAADLESWRPDWVVDALLGTGASGPLREPLDELVLWLNSLPGRKLAVDVPTGLDCDTGAAAGEAFRADVTCTFVAPKIGFQSPSAAEFVGEFEVVGIGAPTRTD